jgi:hypothetical protein
VAKVGLRIAACFHAVTDRVNRLGRIDRPALALVVPDDQREKIEPIRLRRARLWFAFDVPLDLLEGLIVNTSLVSLAQRLSSARSRLFRPWKALVTLHTMANGGYRVYPDVTAHRDVTLRGFGSIAGSLDHDHRGSPGIQLQRGIQLGLGAIDGMDQATLPRRVVPAPQRCAIHFLWP